MLATIQMSSRRLRCSQRGATAIEYAIIAGLIGLGLVGSLVTTRGSLSAVFGTASSQMGSSSAGGSASPTVSTSPRAPFWEAKTVASKTLNPYGGSGQEFKVVYTDGVTVSYLTGQSAPFVSQVTIVDPNSHTYTYAYFDSSGTQNYYQKQEMDAAMKNPVRIDTAGNNAFATFSGNPPQPFNHQIELFSNGSRYSNNTEAPDAAWTAQTQSGFYDRAYFRDLKAAM